METRPRSTRIEKRARLLAPPDRRAPPLFVRNCKAELRADLVLAGVLVLVAWPRPRSRTAALTDEQAQVVIEAETRLIQYRADIGPAACWLGEPLSPFSPEPSWVARRMADHIAVAIRLGWPEVAFSELW